MKDDVSTKDDVSESQGEISEHKWFLGQPKVYQVWVLTKSKDISQEISRNQDDVTVSHGEISEHKWFLVLARFALPPHSPGLRPCEIGRSPTWKSVWRA